MAVQVENRSHPGILTQIADPALYLLPPYAEKTIIIGRDDTEWAC